MGSVHHWLDGDDGEAELLELVARARRRRRRRRHPRAVAGARQIDPDAVVAAIDPARTSTG